MVAPNSSSSLEMQIYTILKTYLNYSFGGGGEGEGQFIYKGPFTYTFIFNPE